MLSSLICRGDNGKRQPSFAHILGSFSAGAISYTYYPPGSRGASLVILNGLFEIAGNAGNNVMREFLFKRIANRPGKSGN